MKKGICKHITKKQVIDTLKETAGCIIDTLKILDMSRSHFYKKFRYDPDVEKVLKESQLMGFEQVTETLFKQCLEGNMKAMSLYLKYNPLSKAEGWVENQTLTLKEEKPLTSDEKNKLVQDLFGNNG